MLSNYIHSLILNFQSKHLHLTNQCGLVQGNSSLLICLHHLYQVTGDKLYLHCLLELLNRLDIEDNYSLGYGASGTLWCLNQMENFYIEDLDEWMNNAEKKLEISFYDLLKADNLDYFKGASGILLYFLTKKDSHKLSTKTDAFLKKVNELLNRGFLPKTNSGEKIINLGTPHGITGILLILLLIEEKELSAKDTISSLLNFLFPKRLISTNLNLNVNFPTHIEPETNKTFLSGLCWCYGDLMLGYAILKASILLDSSFHYNWSVNILRDTLSQEYRHNQKLVLCHGYPSLSHIYTKISDLLPNTEFKERAIFWRNKSISEFEQTYKEYSINGLNKDFFENASLFYGFPGFILSTLSWENKISDKNWLSCLIL